MLVHTCPTPDYSSTPVYIHHTPVHTCLQQNTCPTPVYTCPTPVHTCTTVFYTCVTYALFSTLFNSPSLTTSFYFIKDEIHGFIFLIRYSAYSTPFRKLIRILNKFIMNTRLWLYHESIHNNLILRKIISIECLLGSGLIRSIYTNVCT